MGHFTWVNLLTAIMNFIYSHSPTLFINCSPECSYSRALLKSVFNSSRELKKQKLILPFRLCYCNRSKCFILSCFLTHQCISVPYQDHVCRRSAWDRPRGVGWLHSLGLCSHIGNRHPGSALKDLVGKTKRPAKCLGYNKVPWG